MNVATAVAEAPSGTLSTDGRRRRRLGVYEPSPGAGGPSRSVSSIVRGLDPEEFEVVMFCAVGGGPYRDLAGVRRVEMGGLPPAAASAAETPESPIARPRSLRGLAPPALKLWAGFAAECRRLAAMFRSNPVDLLHSHNTGCEEAPVAARLAGTPRVVGTFHVDPTYDLHGLRSGLRYRLLEHLSNHCLDRGIGVSADAGRAWMRRTHLPARRVVTIPNGIDAEAFRRRTSKATARARLELSSDALVLGGVGRLEEAKGFTYLLDAVAMLAADFPKLMLVVAGRGPLLDDLTRQAGRLGIADRVRFLGFQSDIQGVLDALDVFAMPSLCETLGYALLEAMATELPAVASAVGGIPEVVVANQTGFLAPPRDAGALAAALRPLLVSAELRDRFGGAGRERVVRCFREDEMVRRTIMLYRELCVSPRRSSRARSSAGALA